MTVQERLQSLVTAANATTGGTDADMTAATQSLIAGYGGGETDVVDSILNGTIVEITNDITAIRAYAFAYCNDLVSVSFPNANLVGGSAFIKCRRLLNVNLPIASELRENCFENCRKLQSISLPQTTKFVDSTFSSCSSLTTCDFPLLESMGNSCFYYCNALVSITFPVLTSMGNNSFGGCKGLRSITLQSPTVCTLGGTTLGNGLSADLRIYVPADLVDAYKTATNWVNYSDKILPIP